MNSNDVIQRELNECEGYLINTRLVSFTNSLLIFQANVNEIKMWYKKINDPHAALTIWNPDNYDLMERVNLEMQRLFSNFLSSSFSLRDHLYTLRNVYYRDTEVEVKIQENINKYFVNNNLTSFIQDFRNYVVHCGYPKVSKGLNINQKNISNDLYFDKVELEKYKKWTLNSRRFLELIDTKVKLIDLVTDYDTIINKYYSAIFILLKEYHSRELKELKGIKDKYNLRLHMVGI